MKLYVSEKDRKFMKENTPIFYLDALDNPKSLEQHDKDILCYFAKELYYFINYSYIPPYNPTTGMLAYESRNVLTKEKIYDKINELLKERGME